MTVASHQPWAVSIEQLLNEYQTSPQGLDDREAEQRLNQEGPNEIQREEYTSAWNILLSQFNSPLVLILMGASVISFALGDRTETLIVILMLIIGGLLGFFQEYRSERALRSLRSRLRRQARVIRNGTSRIIDATEIVEGDLVELQLGSVVPADLRLIRVEDLEIDESMITGESVPVPKSIECVSASNPLPQEQINIAFLGTHVAQGSGLGVVVGRGDKTEIGRTAQLLAQKVDETDFQKGIRGFGNFLLKITLALAVIVAVILGLIHGRWGESLLFALALAVGISPELLPIIVTINLSRGALAMSKKHVLVKRLIGIEDLGNADVFCTDKTGTLTMGTLRVHGSINVQGATDPLPLAYAAQCLDLMRDGRASNPIDAAIADAYKTAPAVPSLSGMMRYETISFDFNRRRMSCVIGQRTDARVLVTKGATTEILEVCTHYSDGKSSQALDEALRKKILTNADRYHDQGMRLIAIAKRTIEIQHSYQPNDERDLELFGFLLVSDAPKVTAKAALKALENLNVRIVILTGDNERVTRHIANELEFSITGLLTGTDVERMDETQLEQAAETTNVFARITPTHKLRIIQAFKKHGHTVGFMGDGVNDAPALRAADIGISFESAVDVAKEAAGIILLKKNLSVLADGIREGRKTFVNTRTYLRATISSNFGNMLSVAGASFLLPFIPLLPAQILLLNLLSDLPMLGISTDHVPDEELIKPKKWDIKQISIFMYFFGTISSLADYATFALLLFAAQAHVSMFRSSWFIESVLTEILVIFLLRTKRLSLTQRPGRMLVVASLIIIAVSLLLTQAGWGSAFELVPLPTWLLLSLFAIVAGYGIFTELGKIAYYRLYKMLET